MKTPAASRSVTVNADQGLYVIPSAGGYTCLGFDVAAERCARIAAELKRPDLTMPAAERGTLAGYTTYERAHDAAREHCTATGYRMTCELTPQLCGLEGQRVEVTDKWGITRRFQVGKSIGWMPIHLEIARRNSSGGPAVMGAPFKTVRVIG